MRYKALISFSGKISMAVGEVREITNLPIAEDLLKARYIVALEKPEDKAEEKVETKAKKKVTRKKKGEQIWQEQA